MKCDECNKELEISDWPWCPHGTPHKSKGFESYEDIGLGITVTGWGDINKACRPQWNNDTLTRIEPRDKSESYYRQLNERRREKIEMSKKEQR